MTLAIPSSIATIESLTSMPKEANGKDWGHLPADLAKDSQKEIERLAGLSALKYAEQRTIAAKSLGIGVSGLDEAVREERRSTGGQGKPLELPEPKQWETIVTGQELLSELIAALRRYVVMNDNETVATALWIIQCHAFRAFNIAPRLAITSPEKGCGKTTLLDLLGALVPRALSAANVGAAAVFRVIEMVQPTLLIDEADTFLRDNDELRGILNSGHRKGGSALRCVGDNHEPRQFSTWAPAAIAMIGRLPDTLEDRSIAVRLRRRRPDEAVERLRVDRAKDLDDLARKVARWVADNMQDLLLADPVMPATLSNRAEDNWRPLVVIADVIGGEWSARVRQVAETLVSVASVDEQSAGPMLLADIKRIFEGENVDRVSTEELLNALLKLDDRSWSEWKNGKPMTKAGLSRLLGKFGIISENVRFAGSVLKGYHLHRFEDAFARYLPSESATTLQANSDGHFSQNQTATGASDVAVPKSDKTLGDSDCSGVADYGTRQAQEEKNKTADDANAAGAAQPLSEPVCAQCGGGVASDPPADPPGKTTVHGETVWLHPECRLFFERRR
jgi:putative DNA primase/helicase